MASVVYLPHERRSTGFSDAGSLIGTYLGVKIVEEEKKKQAKTATEILEGIQAAPDRQSAMAVVANYRGAYKTLKDYNDAMEIVEKFHPQSLETPTEVTMYNDAGEEKKVFMPRRQLMRETDPNEIGTMFPGWKIGVKPEMETFYQPTSEEGDYTVLGRRPIAQRPEGALTLAEVEQKRKFQSDKRAADAARLAANRDARGEEALELQRRGLDLQIQRLERTVANSQGSENERVLSRRQRTVGHVMDQIALQMDGKKLADGSWSFGDENKAERYRLQLDFVTGHVAANPSALDAPNAVPDIASRARRTVFGEQPVKREAPPPSPPKESKVPGVVRDAVQKITDPEKAQSLTNARAAAAAIRNSTLPPEEKTKRLSIIKDRLKNAGIQGDL